jgi:hypothetical protein
MTGWELSEKAKFRLKVFDWYRNTSPRFSLAELPDASMSCRYFNIHRSYCYWREKRNDPKQLSTLENKPTVPAKRRRPGLFVGTGPGDTGSEPQLFGEKIRPVLLRGYQASVPSAVTLGRSIARENLCFCPGTKRHKKYSKAVRTAMNVRESPIT